MSETINFIRVQSNLDGISIDKDDFVTIPYDNSNFKNTIHFSLNSIVEGYSDKQENHSINGDFIGLYAIIGTPSNMPIPGGITKKDSWFRVGDIPIAEDTAIMGIKICNAVLVVPEGTTLPKGITALYHSGTEDSRNNVINSYLSSQKQMKITDDNSPESSTQLIKSIYGDESFKISSSSFEDSLDGKIKKNLEFIKKRTFEFQEKPLANYYTKNADFPESASEKTSVYLNKLIAQTKTDINSIYETSTVEENIRIRLQYVEYIREIDKYRRIVNRTEEQIQIDRASASLEELEKQIYNLEGTGYFEIIADGKKLSGKFTEKEISNQITLGLISKDSTILRTGMKEPQSLNKFSDQIEIISQFKDKEIFKRISEINGKNLFIVKDSDKILEARNLEIYTGLKTGTIQAEATISRKGFNLNGEYQMIDIYHGKASPLKPVENITKTFNFDKLANKIESMEEKIAKQLLDKNKNNSNELGL